MYTKFTDIIQLIKQSRTNAIKAINAELITSIGTLENIFTRNSKNQSGATLLWLN